MARYVGLVFLLSLASLGCRAEEEQEPVGACKYCPETPAADTGLDRGYRCDSEVTKSECTQRAQDTCASSYSGWAEGCETAISKASLDCFIRCL